MKSSAPLESFSPYLLSVLRVMAGLLFLEHGMTKILGFPPSNMPASAGHSQDNTVMSYFGIGSAHFAFYSDFHFPPLTMLGFSGVLEFVGGILLVLGLFTRLTAFILSGEMAFAYFMVHAHNNFFPLVNKGELAVLYCFVFLYLAAAGGGPWSIDRLRHRG